MRSVSLQSRALLLALAWTLAFASAPARADLSEADLRAEIEQFALGYAGDPPFAMEIPALRDFSRASAPFGSVSVQLSTSARHAVRGSLPVTVRLRSGGNEFKRGVVTVQLRSDRPTLVAARTIAAGEVIETGDVRQASVAPSKLSRGSFHEASQVVGRRARRTMREGMVFRPDRIEEVPVIRRGGTVRIRLERGPLRIEAIGRAREDGVLGSPIRILNLESRREIVGIVREDGVVHVAF